MRVGTWHSGGCPRRRPLTDPGRRPPRHLARYQVTKDPRRPHDTGIDHIFARCGSQSAAADGGAAAAAAVGEARVYSDGKRCHLTDGVVFCRSGAPYKCGTDPSYFKWKWADIVTVDFRIVPKEQGPRCPQGLAIEASGRAGRRAPSARASAPPRTNRWQHGARQREWTRLRGAARSRPTSARAWRASARAARAALSSSPLLPARAFSLLYHHSLSVFAARPPSPRASSTGARAGGSTSPRACASARPTASAFSTRFARALDSRSSPSSRSRRPTASGATSGRGPTRRAATTSASRSTPSCSSPRSDLIAAARH